MNIVYDLRIVFYPGRRLKIWENYLNNLNPKSVFETRSVQNVCFWPIKVLNSSKIFSTIFYLEIT